MAYDRIELDLTYLEYISRYDEPLIYDPYLPPPRVMDHMSYTPPLLYETLTSSNLCHICGELFDVSISPVVLNCMHVFCLSCMSQYLEFRVMNSQVVEIPCPDHTCGIRIVERIIESVLTPKMYSKYQKFKYVEEMGRNPNLKWCPVPECEGYDIGSITEKCLKCNKCEFNYCFYCLQEWSFAHRCNRNIDYEFDSWAKGNNVKFCPNCRRKIEKNGGCPHMTCAKCGYHWCWKCGEPYFDSHNELKCNLGGSYWDIDWFYITLALLAPLASLFIMPILFVVLLAQVPDNEDHIFTQMRKNLAVWIVLLIIVSPIIETIGLILGSYIFTGVILFECMKPSSSMDIISSLNSILFCMLVITLGSCMLGLTLLLYGLIICISPPVGLIFMFIKLIGRCFSNKNSQGYPRTLI